MVYNEQSWRARRNEKMIADTTRQGPVAGENVLFHISIRSHEANSEL